MSDQNRPLRVLTIDGGGMRGVYSAAYLNGLLEAFSRDRGLGVLDFGKGFDLIVGTSTGALLGCAAAKGIPMTEVVCLYREYGPRIFPVRLRGNWKDLPQLITRPRHLRKGSEAFREGLQSVLGGTTIGEVYHKRKIALAIPAVEMGQRRGWVFKTSHLGGTRDDAYTLVDVCLATSAAPIYRSLAALPAPDRLGGTLVFADGGIWANNPVLVGLVEALRMPETQSIEVFSLGTIPRPEGEQVLPRQLDWGLLKWKLGGRVVQLSIAAQEYVCDNSARMLAHTISSLGRPVRVLRFPTGDLQTSVIPYLDIDDARPEAMDALINQARADVNITKSACDDDKNENGQLIRKLFEALPELDQ